jgi:adenosine deaminase
VERLIAAGITLDLCPTSNVKLGVVRSLGEHPIRTLYQHGVRVTVNTDDPTIFGCSLTSELQALIDHLGFSLVDIAHLQVNAFRVATLPPNIRAEILAEIGDLVGRATLH